VSPKCEHTYIQIDTQNVGDNFHGMLLSRSLFVCSETVNPRRHAQYDTLALLCSDIYIFILTCVLPTAAVPIEFTIFLSLSSVELISSERVSQRK
jgi:hypothetical protein